MGLAKYTKHHKHHMNAVIITHIPHKTKIPLSHMKRKAVRKIACNAKYALWH